LTAGFGHPFQRASLYVDSPSMLDGGAISVDRMPDYVLNFGQSILANVTRNRYIIDLVCRNPRNAENAPDRVLRERGIMLQSPPEALLGDGGDKSAIEH
jgi:hypothetical protein